MTSRVMGFLGVVLIFASVGYILTLMGVFGNDRADDLLLMVVCEDDEAITSRIAPYGSARTLVINDVPVNYFCVDEKGTETEITGQVSWMMGGGFAGLLISGLLLIILAAAGGTSQAVGGITGDGRGVAIGKDESFGTGQQWLTVQAGQNADDLTLAERLQQLEDALSEGLISKGEFENIRDSILDDMRD